MAKGIDNFDEEAKALHAEKLKFLTDSCTMITTFAISELQDRVIAIVSGKPTSSMHEAL